MKLTILTLLLVTSQVAMAELKLKSQYTFGGLNYGLTQVDSSTSSEENKRDGSLYGVSLGHEFKFKSDFNLNVGLEYNKHQLETDLTLPQYSKVYLKSDYAVISVNPTKSFGLVDLGVKADFVVNNEGILTSQTESERVLVGVNGFYNFKINKKDKVRVGLSFQVGTGDNKYTQATASIQYAFGHVKKVVRKKRRSNVMTVTFDDNVVNFKNDSAELSDKSKAFLAEIGTFLHNNLNLWERVEVIGHTSQAGDSDYNKYLSHKRANNVYSVFQEMGVPESKVEVIGKGESQPLVKKEMTAKDSWSNRRVEMRFIKMKKVNELNKLIRILKSKYNLK